MWAPAENFKLILPKKMSFLYLSFDFREKIWNRKFQTTWNIHKMFSKKAGYRPSWGKHTWVCPPSLGFISLSHGPHFQFPGALLFCLTRTHLVLHMTLWPHGQLIPQLQWRRDMSASWCCLQFWESRSESHMVPASCYDGKNRQKKNEITT